MSIRIEKDTCIGCMQCVQICPGSLFEANEGKAKIQYPKDCWGCASCIKVCPTGAISYFLGADIGGMGATMQVMDEDQIMHWVITKADQTQVVIDVNKKDANQY